MFIILRLLYMTFNYPAFSCHCREFGCYSCFIFVLAHGGVHFSVGVFLFVLALTLGGWFRPSWTSSFIQAIHGLHPSGQSSTVQIRFLRI